MGTMKVQAARDDRNMFGEFATSSPICSNLASLMNYRKRPEGIRRRTRCGTRP